MLILKYVYSNKKQWIALGFFKASKVRKLESRLKSSIKNGAVDSGFLFAYLKYHIIRLGCIKLNGLSGY